MNRDDKQTVNQCAKQEEKVKSCSGTAPPAMICWKPPWVPHPTAGLTLQEETSPEIQAEALVSAFPPVSCAATPGRAWLCFCSKCLAAGCCDPPTQSLSCCRTSPPAPSSYGKGSVPWLCSWLQAVWAHCWCSEVESRAGEVPNWGTNHQHAEFGARVTAAGRAGAAPMPPQH